MRSDDAALEIQLYDRFQSYEARNGTLPGISSEAARDTLIWQMVESAHRVRYVEVIQHRDISPERANPQSPLFDPLRASILAQRRGDWDEAFWLVFLFVQFGKNKKSGYRLTRDIYGKLGQGGLWNWTETSKDAEAFRDWLRDNLHTLKNGAVHRAFGNHRKYESLDPDKPRGTGLAVQTYVEWVSKSGGHRALFESAIDEANGDPRVAFHKLYISMAEVISFGRTARFDYLTMVAKLHLAAIEADSPYMAEATGPARGAKLIFGGNTRSQINGRSLESRTVALGDYLGLGMQVMEDSLCNWQKNPETRISFQG